MEHVEMTLDYCLFFAWISAPNSTNARTTFSWPRQLATCKLVKLLKVIMSKFMEHVKMILDYALLFASISAPNSTNARTTRSWPSLLAVCKLVYPLKFITIVSSWIMKIWSWVTYYFSREYQLPIQPMLGPHSHDHSHWRYINSSLRSNPWR